jgi:ABC-type nitrate/sulfonate/bicarbonate transport system substrate-binding protein
LPIYVAEEEGMLEANGLAVRWIDVRDPGQGAKLMAAGKADFILSTFANLMPMEARQPGTLRFLFPTSETRSDPGSYVLVRPDSSIKTLQDLRGHSVGTYSGPSQKAYAPSAWSAITSASSPVSRIAPASSAGHRRRSPTKST